MAIYYATQEKLYTFSEFDQDQFDVNQVLKELSVFRKDHIMTFAMALPHDELFEDGVFQALVQCEINQKKETVYRQIKDINHLTRVVCDEEVILKIQRLERFYFERTKTVKSKLARLLGKIYWLNEIKDFQNTLDGLSDLLTLHAFYGHDKNISFPMHKDPAFVLMVPIFTPTPKDYKTVTFQFKDNTTKSIDFRYGDLVIMEENVSHEVKYRGYTEMISAAFEYEYLRYCPDLRHQIF